MIPRRPLASDLALALRLRLRGGDALAGVAPFSSKRRTRYGDDGELKRRDKLFSALRVKQQEQLQRLRETLAREEREAAGRQRHEDSAAELAAIAASSSSSSRKDAASAQQAATNGASSGSDNAAPDQDDEAAAKRKRKQLRDFERMMAHKAARQDKAKLLPLFREDSALGRLYGSGRTLKDFDNLPELSFDGPIDVIHSAEDELPFVSYLAQQRVIGVDTESMPRFDTKNRPNPVCLIQIATLGRSFLYRIPRGGALAPHLRIMLEDPAVVKVGHSLDDDFRLLKKSELVSAVATTVDTLPVATKLGCLRPGLKTLCKLFLNGNISKEMQVSNWEATELSADQIRYAATDAWAPLRVMLEMIQLDEAKALLLVKSYSAARGKSVSGSQERALATLEDCVLEHRAQSLEERVV